MAGREVSKLGAALRRHRRENDLTPEELAVCLVEQGFPASGDAIRAMEAGEGWPFAEDLRRPFLELLAVCLGREAMEEVALAMAHDLLQDHLPGVDPFAR